MATHDNLPFGVVPVRRDEGVYIVPRTSGFEKVKAFSNREFMARCSTAPRCSICGKSFFIGFEPRTICNVCNSKVSILAFYSNIVPYI